MDWSFYLVGFGEIEFFLVNVVNWIREILKLYGVYNDSVNIGFGLKNFFYFDLFWILMKGFILIVMEIYKICDLLVVFINDWDWVVIESIKVDMNLISWWGDFCFLKFYYWINCSLVDKMENLVVFIV